MIHYILIISEENFSCEIRGFHAFVDAVSTGIVTRAEFGLLTP